MNLFNRILFIAVLVVTTVGVSAVEQNKIDKELPQSRKVDGKFKNIHNIDTRSTGNWPAIAKDWVTNKHKLSEPEYGLIPVQLIDPAELKHGEGMSFYRLGHSTMLLSVDQQWMLIDPVFSKRVSPVQWAGPKRFHDTPISIESLPAIDAVIISHDHYDHLDKGSIKKLKDKVSRFIVPLGVDEHLKNWGISADNIHVLNWWQSAPVNTVTVTATPAQHFSGRGIGDGDHTLWASWAIKGEQANIFYSGDGGYFDGFATIGEQLGPFDLTFIETGAYNTLWANVHMMPEQSVQAHRDVQGDYMVPVHNSTFDLALHAWYEPLERVTAAAEEHDVRTLTPVIGQRVDLNQPSTEMWWKVLMPESDAVK